MGNNRIEQNIPVTAVDSAAAKNPHGCIENPSHLKLSLHYSSGGVNYFTSSNEPRGYYLSVSPVRIEQHDYGNTIATSLMSGIKDLVLQVSRQSDKQLEIATTIAAERAPALLDWCEREYGTRYGMPDEFFPGSPRRAVPKTSKQPAVNQAEKPEEIKPIRRATDDGEVALYSVAADVFGDKLDQVMKDAAYGAMDYIAYVDGTWTPKDAEDKAAMLEMQKPHLDSLAVLLRMASENGCSVETEIREIQAEAERHYYNLIEKPVL